MVNFRKEVKQLSTQDLRFILENQQDYYSNDEISIMRIELASRSGDTLEIENEVEEIIAQEEKATSERLERERRKEQQITAKLNALRQKGYDGYYQYATINLIDNDGGGLPVDQISRILNEYAIEGWRLVTAYANELGHNSKSSGFAGFSSGTNSTIDQHILILERYVKL